MRTYRVVWLFVWVMIALVGVSVAFIASPAALGFLFLAFAALGSMLPLSIVGDYGNRCARDRIRLIAKGALIGGTTAGSFVGFAVTLGAGVFLLVVFLMISSPSALSAYGRWVSSAPKPSAAQVEALARALAYANPEYVPPVQQLGDLRLCTDEQLCRDWRSSYFALQAESSSTGMTRAVEERQRYLDEFERRNRSGFAAWLASGARAPGDPLPYLTGGAVAHPTINWDELTRGQGC